MTKKNGDLDAAMLYRALKSAHGSPDPWAKFVWQNKAPPRVKFFAWLLSQNKIQSKVALRNKNIVDNTVCEVCQHPEETAAHIIFGCPNAKQFWSALQIPTEEDWPIQAILEIQTPPQLPSKHFSTFLLLCCWHIWKRRNNKVFRAEQTSIAATITACKTEAYLWGARLPRDSRDIATAWCSALSSAM